MNIFIENIEIFFISSLLFLFLLNGYLIFQVLRLKKRTDVFLKKGNKDLGEVLVRQLEKIQVQEKDIKEILKEISRLDKITQKSFQKIGIVRFNPFKDMGSDQSFSIALLDGKDNGFVISSLYGREGNRIYAKSIEKGNSQYVLSEEEKQAIGKAKEIFKEV